MSERIVNPILWVCWVGLAVYWFISAAGVKKDVLKSGSYGSLIVIRLVCIFALIYIFNLPATQPAMRQVAAITDHPGLALQIIGIALTVAGVGFALWARIHLGRNWSAVPALKEGHELITTGPYRIVRNPIYTGIMFGLLGSALAGGIIYWTLFLVISVAFVYRVFAEDRLMMKQFPDTYPEYRRKTKALIPFVA